MKLTDINETVFQALSPEVQQTLIEADKADPLIVGLVILMMLMPLVLMR